MLKMTGIKLQKIDNIEMHLFIAKGMRGEISYILKRYSSIKANNTMYWDANNLYGWAIIQSLPVSDFKFLSKEEVSRFDLGSDSENSSIGYILERD